MCCDLKMMAWPAREQTRRWWILDLKPATRALKRALLVALRCVMCRPRCWGKKNPLCHSGLRPNMSSWEWIQCRHARSVHSFVSLIKLHVKYAESDIAFSTVQYELSFPSFLGGSQLREQNRVDSLTAERLRLTVNPIPLSSRLYVQKFIFRISG